MSIKQLSQNMRRGYMLPSVNCVSYGLKGSMFIKIIECFVSESKISSPSLHPHPSTLTMSISILKISRCCNARLVLCLWDLKESLIISLGGKKSIDEY
jgi:hypothetical protein